MKYESGKTYTIHGEKREVMGFDGNGDIITQPAEEKGAKEKSTEEK